MSVRSECTFFHRGGALPAIVDYTKIRMRFTAAVAEKLFTNCAARSAMANRIMRRMYTYLHRPLMGTQRDQDIAVPQREKTYVVENNNKTKSLT